MIDFMHKILYTSKLYNYMAGFSGGYNYSLWYMLYIPLQLYHIPWYSNPQIYQVCIFKDDILPDICAVFLLCWYYLWFRSIMTMWDSFLIFLLILWVEDILRSGYLQISPFLMKNSLFYLVGIFLRKSLPLG